MSAVRREIVALVKTTGNLGERWTSVPKPSMKFLCGHERLSREKGEVIEIGG